MNFLKSSCHCFHYEGVLQVYSAIGNCAVIFQRHSIWRYRDNCIIWHTWQKFANSMSMFVSVAMSMSVYCQFPFPFPCSYQFLCLFLFPCPYPCLFQFKHGAMNIYGRHGNFIVNSQGSHEGVLKLKGPLIWERMVKNQLTISAPLPLREICRMILLSAKQILLDSPFKRPTLNAYQFHFSLEYR
jgi:hypothetical protein